MSNLYPYSGVAVFPQDQLINGEERNTKAGAEVRVYDALNNLVTTFTNAAGDGGATVRTTDANGAFLFYVASGTYRINFDQSSDISVTIGAGVNLSDVAISGNLTDLISGVFNIEDYGAVADNLTDNKTAIDNAISALAANGGGALVIPPNGVFRTSGGHDVPEGMMVKGYGPNSILKRTDGLDGAIFYFIASTRPDIERENCYFDNVRLEGVFDETGEEGDGNGVITLVGYRNVSITNCMFYNIETFGLNMNQCENVRVMHNDFKYICRDACAVWGTPNIIVANNSFVGNDDDCISLNQARFESTNDVMRDGLIVTGNYMRDTGSIKIQQAKNTIISNNIIKLCKGAHGIFIEGLASAQGQPDAHNGNFMNVIIEGNQIVDILSRNLSYKPDDGSTNERVGIKIDSKSPTDTEYDYQYQYNYSDTGPLDSGPITECFGLFVRNNVIRRTHSPDGVKTYSELFGFGRMFSRFKGARTDTPIGYISADGFVDPVINDVMLNMRPMEIRDGFINSEITGNYMQGGAAESVRFILDTWTLTDLMIRDITFKDNTFRDFSNAGIDLTDYANSEQRIHVYGNTFDADPYNKDSLRNADGSWINQGGSSGLSMTSVKGVTVKGNTFKNVAVPFVIGSANTSTNVFSGNIYVGEPSTTDIPRNFQTTNKGLGIFPWNEDPEGILDYVISDPNDVNYLKRLPKQLDRVSAASPPSDGYYFKGQTLLTTRSVVDTGSILLGFRRLTDGNAHVSGTDWQPLYASITA